jgi:hypothetical protein
MSLESLLGIECRRPLAVATVAASWNGSWIKLFWLIYPEYPPAVFDWELRVPSFP